MEPRQHSAQRERSRSPDSPPQPSPTMPTPNLNRSPFEQRNSCLLPTAVSLQRPEFDPIDLRTLEYAGPCDDNLVCSICYNVFVNPVKLECEHVFCQRCVNKALRLQEWDTKGCPTCRAKPGLDAIYPVPKIVLRILDDLVVNCPQGCKDKVRRVEVQDHVDKYCAYSEVECPSSDCLIPVLRKDLESKRCLHRMLPCLDCFESVMERDLQLHHTSYCVLGTTPCPDCKADLLIPDMKAHIDSCPEAIFSCPAHAYGCDIMGKRADFDEHAKSCPLAKLMPFLKTQNERLEAHESALKLLRHKNAILESSLASMQDTLDGPSTSLIDTPSTSRNAANPSFNGPNSAPFDSTAHHLLCLHESLREEVARVSAQVSDLDAKASMMVINETLRVKEDLSHTNAAIGGMRAQLHWLMSARLQNQQRLEVARARSANGSGVDGGEPSRNGSGGSTEGLAGRNGNIELPVRRLSDSLGRQETKL